MIGRRVAAAMAVCVGLAACDNPNDPGGDPCDVQRDYQIGETVNGQLTRQDCELGDGSYADFYQFTIGTTRQVSIRQRSNELDSYLLLYTSSGSEVARDDDSDPGTDFGAQIDVTLNPGTYVIVANSFDEGATGSYQLTSAAF